MTNSYSFEVVWFYANLEHSSSSWIFDSRTGSDSFNLKSEEVQILNSPIKYLY
jgi:hypothetical protein